MGHRSEAKNLIGRQFLIVIKLKVERQSNYYEKLSRYFSLFSRKQICSTLKL